MARLSSLPCARILVLGDSGVGKSSLIAALSSSSSSSSSSSTSSPLLSSTASSSSPASWTIGCAAHTLLLQSSSSSAFFVELFDVGGHRKYAGSRAMFYREVDGLLLVFDVGNRKSYRNLQRWIREVVDVDRERSVSSGALDALPVLVCGNKMDTTMDDEQVGMVSNHPHFDAMKDYGLEMRLTSALVQPERLLPALLPFFQRVLDVRQQREHFHTQSDPHGQSEPRAHIHSHSQAPLQLQLTQRKASALPSGHGGRLSWAGAEAAEEENEDGDDSGGLTIDLSRLDLLNASAASPSSSSSSSLLPSSPSAVPASSLSTIGRPSTATSGAASFGRFLPRSLLGSRSQPREQSRV